MGVPTPGKKANLPFLLCVILLGLSMDRMAPVHTGKDGSSLLSPLMQILTSSGNTFTDKPRNKVLPATGHSLT
jgi:hypothetical protein